MNKAEIVGGVMDSVKESLTNGGNVYLRGFGSFILKHHAEKALRNIRKNTSTIILAFKSSQDFTLD